MPPAQTKILLTPLECERSMWFRIFQREKALQHYRWTLLYLNRYDNVLNLIGSWRLPSGGLRTIILSVTQHTQYIFCCNYVGTYPAFLNPQTALFTCTYAARPNNAFDMQVGWGASWHDCCLVRFRKKLGGSRGISSNFSVTFGNWWRKIWKTNKFAAVFNLQTVSFWSTPTFRISRPPSAWDVCKNVEPNFLPVVKCMRRKFAIRSG